MSVTALPDLLQQLMESEDSSVTISPGWAQGRAVFGGLAAAIGLVGMEKVVGEGAPLRSLMTNFVAPMPQDRVKANARIMRSGRAVTQASVDVMAGDQVTVHASAAFGAARDGKSVAADAEFRAAPRESVPPLDAVRLNLPGFLQRFDIHWTGGGIPRSGTGDRSTGMWVRNRENMDAFPAAKIVAIADMPPPVMMAHYTQPVMASSLSWSLEFVRPAEEVETEWFYLDYELEAAAGGYSQQNGRIFDEHGQLCALSRQCMVYFE